MKNADISVQYIYHSGFLVETKTESIIFDYFKGKFSPLPENKLFFFSSHSHPDHFNKEILSRFIGVHDAFYILSSDIEDIAKSYTLPANTTYMSNGDEIDVGSLHIKAFGSTDLGISFLVCGTNYNIFHAGDLNWWHWSGESSEENLIAEKNFKIEIANIKNYISANKMTGGIDIAFFPVDPRMGEFFNIGAEYFIRELSPSVLIPMHFGNDITPVKDFSKGFNSSGKSTTHIHLLSKKGETIRL